ncbi:MAG TPA: hypothetical protein VFQ75_00460, partial [Candidatus Limnocylindrales bacterium]|nr:hypothetical protein [Candidatus Limnocylindrales bacterium]
ILLDNAGELGRSRTRKGEPQASEDGTPVDGALPPVEGAVPVDDGARAAATDQPGEDLDEDLLAVAPPTPPEWEPPALRRPAEEPRPDDTQE